MVKSALTSILSYSGWNADDNKKSYSQCGSEDAGSWHQKAHGFGEAASWLYILYTEIINQKINNVKMCD